MKSCLQLMYISTASKTLAICRPVEGLIKACLDHHLDLPACPLCIGLSSAKPLEQTDLFLQAGLCPGTLVFSNLDMAAFHHCSEHGGETKLRCYPCNMHECYWATCTLFREESLASHMQKSSILTLVWTSLQELWQKVNIYPASYRQAWARATSSQPDKHKLFYLVATL